MWRHHGIMVLRHNLHNNHKFCLQPQVLGMRISTQGIGDYKVMGAKYWSHDYRR
jgi:hypothetical protein